MENTNTLNLWWCIPLTLKQIKYSIFFFFFFFLLASSLFEFYFLLCSSIRRAYNRQWRSKSEFYKSRKKNRTHLKTLAQIIIIMMMKKLQYKTSMHSITFCSCFLLLFAWKRRTRFHVDFHWAQLQCARRRKRRRILCAVCA